MDWTSIGSELAELQGVAMVLFDPDVALCTSVPCIPRFVQLIGFTWLKDWQLLFSEEDCEDADGRRSANPSFAFERINRLCGEAPRSFSPRPDFFAATRDNYWSLQPVMLIEYCNCLWRLLPVASIPV